MRARTTVVCVLMLLGMGAMTGAHSGEAASALAQEGALTCSDEVPALSNLAIMLWGESGLTAGDEYIAPGPPWWSGAFKIGGQWLPDGWYVNGDGSNVECSLNVDLDRLFLTNDLRMVVSVVSAPGGSLAVDLYDTNDTVIVAGEFGGLPTEGGSVVVTAAVPTSVYSDAVGIRLRPGPGEMLIQEAVLFVESELARPGGEPEAQAAEDHHGSGDSSEQSAGTDGSASIHGTTVGDPSSTGGLLSSVVFIVSAMQVVPRLAPTGGIRTNGP